jgi:tetratricopeptide (TPR) repeat protein
MLATIQEFGHEQLAATGEVEAARLRHAAYFLRLAEEAQPHLYYTEQIVWLDRLEEELGNLRAAWGWCVARGQAGDQEAPERGMVTAGHLYNFWHMRGHLQEGLEWLTRLLAAPVAPTRTRGRAAALYCLALMHGLYLGDLTTAHVLGEESVAIARELGEKRELAVAVFCHGVACDMFPRPGTDDLARACAYLAEAQTLYEEADNEDGWVRAGIAFTPAYRGMALLAVGDLTNAEMQLTRGLELTTASGDRFNASVALSYLGHLARIRGDPAGARTRIEQALAHHEALQNHFNVAWRLNDIGDLLGQTGDRSAARAHYARALRMLHAVGHAEISHKALYGLVGLAMEAREPADALHLVSVSKTLSAVTGVLPSPSVRTQMEQVEAAAREVLSPEAQAAAWAAGQTMPVEQVIAEALAQAEPEAE